ncbi:MAG TPA: DNA primase [Candidatus Eisenbacteria bacterium]|jgi:DNA primase
MSGIPARGADDWVERVRAASDIVDVVRQTVSLKRSGRNWVGLCPFHKEKTPSFSVHAERQFYHCFSCNAGGDVFKFVQETEKVGFMEAVELLSRRAGIPVPERRTGGVERGIRARLQEALEAAATAYEQWLGDPAAGASARAYLEGRGLTHATIRAFRLGLAPPGWEPLSQRLKGRFPPELLVQAGLAAPRRAAEEGGSGRGGIYDRFRNRLMVPLVAPGGAVVGFGARALAEGDEPKYLNSPETPVYRKGGFLFALEQARRQVEPDGEMIVVEGYFDAIALHQAGLANCVATSGTALTADQARLLRRLVARVALTYDGDAAGREAMMRSLGVLLGEGLEVAVVDLPQGDDPDTLVRRGGIAAWSELRSRAADPVEFVQRHVLRATDAARGADPRERALQAVVTLAGAVRDPVRVKLLFERAAELLGFAASVLERALALRASGQGVERPLAAAVRERREREHGIERLLLQALIQAPAARDEVGRSVTPADFRDPRCAAVARWLWEGGEGLPAEDDAAALARELALDEREGRDWSAEATGAARRMMVRRLRQEMQEREQERRRSGADPEAERRLSQEIYEIARSLKNLSDTHTQGEAGT